MVVWGLAFFLLLPLAAHARTFSLVTLDSPPLEYPDDEGQPRGLNVEIALEALRRMGHEARVEFVPWKRALEMVRSGKADAILDAGFNPERATYLHYPQENIYLEEIFAFKRADRRLTLDEGLGNASDYHLGVGRGYYYGTLMDQAIKDGRFKSVHEVFEEETGIKMLAAGRIDMLLGVRVPILFLLKRMGLSKEIDIVPGTGTGLDFALGSSPTYLAFSRTTVSKAFAWDFSMVLQSMKLDGSVTRIARRYGLP